MGSDDDFLTSSHAHLGKPCDLDNSVIYTTTWLRGLAAVSIACYMYLFWMYFVIRTPVLKRHPTRIAIYSCVFQVGFFLQYLWLPTVGKDYLYEDDANEHPYYCNSSIDTAYWAFFTQFCMMGTQLCFLVISVDLRNAYTNPFSSYKLNKPYFAALVLLGSLGTATALMLMGPRVYGFDEHGYIWIQGRRAKRAINWPKFVLYYIETSLIFLYSIWANFQFYRTNEQGMAETISNRLIIMLRSKRFVVGHISVDSVILFLEFAAYLRQTKTPQLLYLPAYLTAARGIFGFCVIIYSNWDDITWESMNPFRYSLKKDMGMVETVALEGLLQQPHLNTALRAEILYFTTQGIMFAVREAQRDAERRRSPDHRERSHNHSHSTTSSTTGGSGGDDQDHRRRRQQQQQQQQQQQDPYLQAGRTGTAAGATGTAVGAVDEEDAEEYTFDNRNSEGIRPSIVAEALFGQQQRPVLLKHIHNDEATAVDDSVNNISRLRKAQEERVYRDREEAFMNEVEYLGLHRDSIRFNDPGLANQYRTGAMIAGTAGMTAAPQQQLEEGYGNSSSGGGGGGDAAGTTAFAGNHRSIFNPLAAAAPNRQVSSSGYSPRASELEMQETPRSSSFLGGGGARMTSVASTHSVISDHTTSSQATVKWRDTMDVEFSMGMGNRNRSTSNGLSSSRHSAGTGGGHPHDHKNSPRNGTGAAGRSSQQGSENSESWYRLPSPARITPWFFRRSERGGGGGGGHGASSANADPAAAGNGDETGSVLSGDSGHTGASAGGSATTSISGMSQIGRSLKSAISRVINPAYREFRFKDFSPRLFARVREMCQISTEDYARSFETTCKESFSEGRSGAFLFYSSDQKYISKSCTKYELQCLRRLMPDYVDHLTKNPTTLICRFLGAHCITMYGVELYFMVMLNFFPTYRLSERYDLKGSWVSRHGFTGSRKTKTERKRREVPFSPILYLDNDLQHKLSLQPGISNLLADEIYKDLQFFTQHSLMDYSLLVGVKKERYEVVRAEDEGGGGMMMMSPGVAGASGRMQGGGGHGYGDGNNRESMRASLAAPNGRITDIVPAVSSRGSSSQGGGNINSDKSGTGHGGGGAIGGGGAGGGEAEDINRQALKLLARPDEGEDQIDHELDGGLRTRFVEGPGRYYIGIIDVLQEWTWAKRLEHAIKVYIYRYDPQGVSAIQPDEYAKRFWRRCVIDTFEGLEEQQQSAPAGRRSSENTSTTAPSEQLHRSTIGTNTASMGAGVRYY